MSETTLIDAISDLLAEAAVEPSNEKNRTADGKTKHIPTEKPKANTSAEVEADEKLSEEADDEESDDEESDDEESDDEESDDEVVEECEVEPTNEKNRTADGKTKHAPTEKPKANTSGEVEADKKLSEESHDEEESDEEESEEDLEEKLLTAKEKEAALKHADKTASKKVSLPAMGGGKETVKKDGKKWVKEEDESEEDEEDEEGDELSEDFRVKAQVIFESAVGAKVNVIREELEAVYESRLIEELETINTQVQEYVEYAVSEWLKENSLEIKYSLRQEIAENFISGLKNLFQESYIEIPDEDVSVVDELTEACESYKDQIAEQATMVESMQAELLAFKRAAVVSSLSEELTMTQAVKLEALAETVDADSIEEFEFKLAKLKEAHFVDMDTESFSPLAEEVVGEPVALTEDSLVSLYAKTMSTRR